MAVRVTGSRSSIAAGNEPQQTVTPAWHAADDWMLPARSA
jgi:hypothetical protein